MITPQDNYIEKTVEEFDTKFEHSEECSTLRFIDFKFEKEPFADCYCQLKEIKDFIRKALENQRSELLSCLPGTVVLDQEFYSEENQNSREFNQWFGAVECKAQFLKNLKEKGLIE